MLHVQLAKLGSIETASLLSVSASVGCRHSGLPDFRVIIGGDEESRARTGP